MNKKNIIIGLIIIILAVVGFVLSQTIGEEKNIENKTIANLTLNETDNITIEEVETVSKDNSNSHNGLKYKFGVWYDPNDPSTWYDADGNWQKMESDVSKEFLYEHSGPNDKFYNSHGQEVSKEEYFNDPMWD